MGLSAATSAAAVTDENDEKVDQPSSWVDPAAQVATNAATAMASAAFGPEGAAAVAGISPLLTKLFGSIGRRYVDQSTRSGTQVLAEAAEELDGDIDGLEARIGEDPARLLLAGTAVDAGCHTIHADKIRALGRALAAGVADDALVDAQMLVVAALADMEAPHIKVLRHIAEEHTPKMQRRPAESRPRTPTWPLKALETALPEAEALLLPILATLERHAAVDVDRGFAEQIHRLQRLQAETSDRDPFVARGVGRRAYVPHRPLVPDPQYTVTTFGLSLLELLRSVDQP